jgi:hypothetical protein
MRLRRSARAHAHARAHTHAHTHTYIYIYIYQVNGGTAASKKVKTTLCLSKYHVMKTYGELSG